MDPYSRCSKLVQVSVHKHLDTGEPLPLRWVLRSESRRHLEDDVPDPVSGPGLIGEHAAARDS